MTVLYIAAGGGGDAIASRAIGELINPGAAPSIATLSWDRLIIDPLPGPRSIKDFDGLRSPRASVYQVTPASKPIERAGSSLPRLAGALRADLYLLDPHNGVDGLGMQITAIAEHIGATELLIVDVGGDILALGPDIGLRSPTADLMTLAASSTTRIPTRVLVTGIGLDGELSPELVSRRLEELRATTLATLNSQFEEIQDVFSWHPSEASGMLAAAANGVTGKVEVRDAGLLVELNSRAATAYAFDAASLLEISPGRHLIGTTSLGQVEDLVATHTGINDLEYERQKAAAMLGSDRPQTFKGRHSVDINELLRDARDRGADFVTLRRLSEATGCKDSGARGKLADFLQSRILPPSLVRTRV
ncbi:MAG: DUF1152 domain-containing protein [Corynebacteriales bacterium]|nr:DUF1152 domain-containing protein [Mycobacteriales bacterium]